MRISRKLTVVIIVHLLHAAVLLVVTAYGMKALSASRAYVEGEGLWSKAQKEGTLHLIEYAESGNESRFQAFLGELDVTLGDRQARLELDKAHPDMDLVRDGFLRGRLDPGDIEDMAWLYRNFAWEPHLAKAISIWATADAEIQVLLAKGEEVRAEVALGNATRLEELETEVYAIDARLTVLEDDFSRDLGDGVRWLTGVVNLAAIGLTVVFVGLALTISTMAARQITHSLTSLRQAAAGVSAGDLSRRVGLDGRDEVADVGRAFDAMADRVAAMLDEVKAAAVAQEAAAAQHREIERLGQLDVFRTQFINTAAHELRTPLTPLRAQLHVLKVLRAPSYTPEEKRSLETAERNVERLALLVEDLLQVSRYQAGRMAIHARQADVWPVVHEAVDTFAAAAKAKSVDLTFTSTGPGVAHIDAQRVSQVLYNLLSNALKFTATGGHIQVRGEAVADGVRVQVADDGIGIAATDLPRLFQPFTQVHEQQVAQPGSGLGLYICRAIVELHGGTIVAESAGHGKGTTFTIWLPKAPAAP